MSKRTFDKLPSPARYLTVVGTSLITAVCLCLIMSGVAASSPNPTANLSLYGNIAFVISMFVCGFLGAKAATEGKFLCGILSAALMLTVIVAASIVFGGVSFSKETLLACIGVAAAIIGALLGAREKKRKRKR